MLAKLSLIIFGTLFLSCATTPLVFSGLGYCLGELSWPFSRVFDRVAMVWLAVLLIWFRHWLKMPPLREYFAEPSGRRRWIHFCLGLLLTFLTVMAVLPIEVWSGRFVAVDRSVGYFLGKLPKVLLGGVIVSVLEELFFRVILLRKLAERMSFVFAAILSSALYAFVHFISPSKSYAYDSFQLLGGFEYFAVLLSRFLFWEIYPQMFGLFLVGLILCFAIQRSNSIYLCIGMHAGWAMSVKLGKYAVRSAPEIVVPKEVGYRYQIVADPLAWSSILFVGVLLFFVYRKNRSEGNGAK